MSSEMYDAALEIAEAINQLTKEVRALRETIQSSQARVAEDATAFRTRSADKRG